ncbi:ankyrin repeat domain-containing protein [Thioflexithrix psekupsensis]|uniref:Uncharacterized protein n=1 Tax=Thioflexithrix psekupsensis TaxID=1570016 RepID=A0A251X5R8_9GAMM|nr:ankyrin repeat domain-containing protein [Thioflexithrix psekupsensis]OUD12885.1 hypothetical protein TPSD3_12110 [Thioflexithrix psekupsensis]
MGLFDKLKNFMGNADTPQTHHATDEIEPYSPEALDSPPYRFVEALHAARQGQVAKIQDYLQFNAHYALCKNWDDCMLLHEAAASAQTEVLKQLLNAGSPVNALYKGNTPLHLLIEADETVNKSNASELIENRKQRRMAALVLIERGADLQATNEAGENPLHLAARLGLSELVDLLLNKGVDVNSTIDSDKPNAGRTALLLVARYNKDKRTFKRLLDQGADPNRQDQEPGFAALHYLASYRATNQNIQNIKESDLKELTQLLIQHHANLNLPTLDKQAYTPLHLAIIHHHLEMVTALVDAGANLHAQDAKGLMPLGIAARRGEVELVKYLLDKGTDLYRSRALFHAASCTDSSAVMEYLFERGIDINMPDPQGYTPIFSAISAYSLKNVKLLMEKGIDIKQHSPRGLTVLEHAFACWGAVEDVSGEEIPPERKQQADNARDIIQLLGGFDTPQRNRYI